MTINVTENGTQRKGAELIVTTTKNVTATINAYLTTANPEGVNFGVPELGRYLVVESAQLNGTTLGTIEYRIYYTDADVVGINEKRLRKIEFSSFIGDLNLKINLRLKILKWRLYRV